MIDDSQSADDELMEDVYIPWRMCKEAQRLRMWMSIALGLWLGGPAVGLWVCARAREIGVFLFPLGLVGVGGFVWWCLLVFRYWCGWRSFRDTGDKPTHS